ncbi:hypothetical protein [Endozoicomonas sp. SCSIO W0465]|uniref:hypothetical protein n=1 Tax=Endozoicomonas sp. SCSIO W0465 TaxID=2918516 RepID=UPI002075A239|nr:hypothetical protein [Endozoicomonas sp. SCSIO W0465]USE37710.1 hypothetical protein MJO57_05790 [Endozoicomonas sp. SCSIO W0465]
MQSNAATSFSSLSPLPAASSPDTDNPPTRDASTSGRFAHCQPKAMARANQLSKSDPALTNDVGTKNTSTYKITTVNDDQLKQIIEFKNRFLKTMIPKMCLKSIMEGLKLFANEDYLARLSYR